jgi:nitrogen fixation protein FixH
MFIRADLKAKAANRPREVTGGTVLTCFLAFFGIVGAVNAVMIQAATSTFRGVETGSSYQAGLAFANEMAAAHAQEALHWQVNGRVQYEASNVVRIVVNVSDRIGAASAHLAASARFAHPTDARFDRHISLDQVAPGQFTGITDRRPGQWDLIIDLSDGQERLFRSKGRIVLR